MSEPTGASELDALVNSASGLRAVSSVASCPCPPTGTACTLLLLSPFLGEALPLPRGNQGHIERAAPPAGIAVDTFVNSSQPRKSQLAALVVPHFSSAHSLSASERTAAYAVSFPGLWHLLGPLRTGFQKHLPWAAAFRRDVAEEFVGAAPVISAVPFSRHPAEAPAHIARSSSTISHPRLHGAMRTPLPEGSHCRRHYGPAAPSMPRPFGKGRCHLPRRPSGSTYTSPSRGKRRRRPHGPGSTHRRCRWPSESVMLSSFSLAATCSRYLPWALPLVSKIKRHHACIPSQGTR